MDNTAPIVRIRNLSFYYGSEPVLDGVNLDLSKGDYIGLVGPNGSGKSTLVKLLLGLLPVQSGTVELFGHSDSQFSDWQRIGYVPQHVFRGDRSFPATVREVVESGHVNESSILCQLGLWQCEPIAEALKTANIEHLIDRRIGELSGGERQRVFIARALVSKPDLLILDEPTAGIDQTAQEAFYDLLEKLNRRHGITILLISHDLEIIAHEAKTAVCLNHSIVYTGPATALHDDEVIKRLFGSRVHHTDHI
ncbi:MAG: metal ABC transporter ATP-binding protein [Candidatus Moraniibacteriota bacterium]